MLKYLILLQLVIFMKIKFVMSAINIYQPNTSVKIKTAKVTDQFAALLVIAVGKLLTVFR